MCSLFFAPSRNIDNNLSNMEQNFRGDLTDILRGSANNITNSSYGDQPGLPNITDNTWHFSSDHTDHHHNNSIGNINSTNNFPPLLSTTTTTMEDHHHHHHHQVSSMINLPDHHMPFGDPFSNMGDPLLHDPEPTAFFDTAASGFFAGPEPGPTQLHQEAKFRPSCNIFSRMLQISPAAAAGSGAAKQVSEAATMASGQCDNSAAAAAAAVASPRAVIKAADSMISVSGGSAVESMAAGGGMQISSPRNPGIKRRKSQAKKVVCIPAPAAANSRATGEVVPSDLWAWRKYGQKPIKGSPYPRGYYRCSSSKGCSARKQVERSRTDPNMLVITYTSEHNHPWPTQRNALAGSTRSQPSKATSASSKTSPITSSQNHQLGQIKNTTSTTSPKEELNYDENNNNNASVSTTSASVKEENIDQYSDKLNDDAAFSTDDHHNEVGFGYRPALCSNDAVNGSDQDAFFAELGEIEADPLNLLFSQGFASSLDNQQQQHKGLVVTGNNDNKGLGHFSMFDWSEGNNNNNNNKQRE